MAKAVRVKTNPEVIKYYVEKSAYDLRNLTQDNQLKFLENWMDGTRNPTLNQLTKLSTKLEVPLGYLAVKAPIDDTPALLNYRTLETNEIEMTSRNLIEVIKISKVQQEYIADHRKNNGYSTLKYVDYFTENDHIKDVVKYTRELFDMPVNWQDDLEGLTPFKYFRQKMNNVGVIIQKNGIVGQNTHRILDIEEFRAFVIIDNYAPFIFINMNDTQNGQLFSLLHEFAHILVGTDNVFNASLVNNIQMNHLEVFCNQFASELLVPNKRFIEVYNFDEKIKLYDYISDIAKLFKVSKTVIARKAMDNQFISAKQYTEIAKENYEEFKQFKHKQREKGSGGNYYNTIQSKVDLLLFDTLKNDYYEGNIQYNDVLRILNIGNKGFNYLDNINQVNEVDLH